MSKVTVMTSLQEDFGKKFFIQNIYREKNELKIYKKSQILTSIKPIKT